MLPLLVLLLLRMIFNTNLIGFLMLTLGLIGVDVIVGLVKGISKCRDMAVSMNIIIIF